MKWDFAIGNPPYMESTDSDSSRMPPVYNYFMDAAYDIAEKVELITPARFLFNAGYTPKPWNEKMLNDPHFKVMEYETDASKIFANTDIKGGIAISYRDNERVFGAIETFTKYPELNAILRKVKGALANGSMASIAFPPLSYGLSDAAKRDYPDSIGRLRTSAFIKLSDIFFNSPPKDDNEYIAIIGLEKLKRKTMYVKRKYIVDKNGILDKWNLIIPEAAGIGSFGEKTPSPEVAPPSTAFLQTFVGLGAFDTDEEIEPLKKYIKTKFARALLGVYKITQHCSPSVWREVPLQNFTHKSDINWNTSIANIDKQLYKKYGLSQEEIDFIETHVKEMA